jgi:hypothetical protein
MIEGKRVFSNITGLIKNDEKREMGYWNLSGSKGLSMGSVSPLIMVLANSLPTAGTIVIP